MVIGGRGVDKNKISLSAVDRRKCNVLAPEMPHFDTNHTKVLLTISSVSRHVLLVLDVWKCSMYVAGWELLFLWHFCLNSV